MKTKNPDAFRVFYKIIKKYQLLNLHLHAVINAIPGYL